MHITRLKKQQYYYKPTTVVLGNYWLFAVGRTIPNHHPRAWVLVVL